MTPFNAELAEQLRAERYREATERLAELEQKRLSDIFPTLSAAAIRVEAGDRGAMLELLGIAADSLRCFKSLPQQTRDALADGLEKMRNNLEEAKGFLPRKRGERAVRDKRAHDKVEFFTALAVEWARLYEGLSLEDAVAKVEEESGMTESLIHKRWKRHHRGAKDSLSMARAMLESAGVALPTLLRRRKRRF